MNRTTLAAAVSATLLAGGAAGVAVATAGSAEADHAPAHPRTVDRTYVVHDIDGNMAMADLAEPHGQDPDIGDEVAFTQRLTRHGHRVGRISNVAFGADHDKALFQSNGTMRLGKGDITFAGLVSQTPHFVLAVTGGTGRYRDAAGTIAFDFSGRPTVALHLVR